MSDSTEETSSDFLGPIIGVLGEIVGAVIAAFLLGLIEPESLSPFHVIAIFVTCAMFGAGIALIAIRKKIKIQSWSRLLGMLVIGIIIMFLVGIFVVFQKPPATIDLMLATDAVGTRTAEAKQTLYAGATQTFIAKMTADFNTAVSDAQTMLSTKLFNDAVQTEAAKRLTETQSAILTAAATPPAQPMPTPDLELTAIYEANAAATSTELAKIRATSVIETAQVAVVTRAGEAESTQIAKVATSQVVATSISNTTPLLFDDFESNSNGWAPKSASGYAVSIDKGTLNIVVTNSKLVPFPWTCDNCLELSNLYSIQTSIQVPDGVAAGILFGSPIRVDDNSSKYLSGYVFSFYSSGDFYLDKITVTGTEHIGFWYNQGDLLNSSSTYHVLQIIYSGNSVSLFVDGNQLESSIQLDTTTPGFFGLIVQQTTTVPVRFDNLRVIQQ